MRTLLIVEDEPPVAEAWKRLLNSTPTAHQWNIEMAYAYSDAERLLRSRKFDAIISDLLLLPPGSSLVEGKIREQARNGTFSERRFSEHDWRKFVLEQGGVGLIRWVRHGTASRATATNVPVIATSFFDAMPGYEKIARMLGHSSPTLIVPKFFKNPESRDFSIEIPIRTAAQQVLRHFLAGDFVDAQVYANGLRTLLYRHRGEFLEAAHSIGNPGRASSILDEFKIHTYSFVLVVRFDPRGDPATDRAVAVDNEFYPLSHLYEDWNSFRNRILLNPLVRLEFELHVKQRPEGTQTAVIPLRRLSQPTPDGTPMAEHELRSALRLRCLLAYLAHSSEPPQGLSGHGWTIPSSELLCGTMCDIGELPRLRQEPIGDANVWVMDWGGVEVKLDDFFDNERGNGSVSSLIKDMRGRLEADVVSYYEHLGRQPPFQSTHVVVSRNRPTSGYYFNGDLQLVIDREALMNPDLTSGRIFLWPMAPSQEFECLDGAIVPASAIEDRLRGAFANRVQRVNGIGEVLNAGRKGDVLVCVPVDATGVGWWVRELQGEMRSVERLKQSEIRVVLLPDTEAASSVAPPLFAQLEQAGIHCVYTKGYTAVPEGKLLDAVICTGPRVKYRGRALDDAENRAKWRGLAADLFPEFSGAYQEALADAILGETTSGSASIRIENGSFLVTSSRTDKSVLTRDDLAYVLNASPSHNEVTWSGFRRPTSGSPWHAYLYGIRPEIGAILHTHNKLITYARAVEAIRTARYVPYGTIEIGRAVDEILRKGVLSGRAVVLNGHGEVIVGETLDDCVQTLRYLHEYVVQAEREGGPS